VYNVDKEGSTELYGGPYRLFILGFCSGSNPFGSAANQLLAMFAFSYTISSDGNNWYRIAICDAK